VTGNLTLEFVVNDEQVISAFRNLEEGLTHLIVLAAEDLSESARLEAGHASHRLAAPWAIEGIGSTERRVVAPEWWAGFLAHGTQAHGPKKADHLVFTVDGEVVFADFVQGIPADPFDQRAVTRTASHVDEIMRRVIETAT